ncbi:MAG: hypothetical protein PHU91_01530 [Candidatus Omnitrophica bacterium]|nr:hypothetical protein [Candidatus Omnitrophota bacterium]MDD5236342.1 hypothetical protein [Candidatus Omnitrophota bacterium]MDD5610224.1 hypothetical protein [Candidatus Omnitrophota bacterium]
MGWNSVLVEPVKALLGQVGNFISRLAFVILILIVGWLIARFIKYLIIRLLKLITLDELADKAKINEVIQKGGISYTLSELIGIGCYWIVILITLVLVVNALGLSTAADLLNRIVLYIPNVIAAVFILVLGLFSATLLSNLVQTVAANAGIAQARLLGKVSEVITVVFAIIIALEQLQITGILIIERIILILLASMGLAVALAFGLGCKEIAGKYVHDLIERVKSKK